MLLADANTGYKAVAKAWGKVILIVGIVDGNGEKLVGEFDDAPFRGHFPEKDGNFNHFRLHNRLRRNAKRIRKQIKQMIDLMISFRPFGT